MSPADDIELQPDFVPAPVREIASVETLRAISDPTRLRLMEAMVARVDPPWSVKELAATLGVPQTRLYHHIDLLLTHDIIRPVERRVVSGIIETRYRASALSFQIDRRIFSGDKAEASAAVGSTLSIVFDTTRDEIEAAMRSGAIDREGGVETRQATISRTLARLSPARAGELHRRLRDVIAEFGADDEPGGTPIGLVVAAYPLPSTAKDPTDG